MKTCERCGSDAASPGGVDPVRHRVVELCWSCYERAGGSRAREERVERQLPAKNAAVSAAARRSNREHGYGVRPDEFSEGA